MAEYSGAEFNSHHLCVLKVILCLNNWTFPEQDVKIQPRSPVFKPCCPRWGREGPLLCCSWWEELQREGWWRRRLVFQDTITLLTFKILGGGRPCICDVLCSLVRNPLCEKPLSPRLVHLLKSGMCLSTTPVKVWTLQATASDLGRAGGQEEQRRGKRGEDCQDWLSVLCVGELLPWRSLVAGDDRKSGLHHSHCSLLSSGTESSR